MLKDKSEKENERPVLSASIPKGPAGPPAPARPDDAKEKQPG